MHPELFYLHKYCKEAIYIYTDAPMAVKEEQGQRL
jgi:hypothetical protein